MVPVEETDEAEDESSSGCSGCSGCSGSSGTWSCSCSSSASMKLSPGSPNLDLAHARWSSLMVTSLSDSGLRWRAALAALPCEAVG